MGVNRHELGSGQEVDAQCAFSHSVPCSHCCSA
jgi:hypothetical protein